MYAQDGLMGLKAHRQGGHFEATAERQTAEGQDYGFFGLTNTGSFRVLGVYGSAIYQFYDFKSEAINQAPGAVNRLTVRALGDNFAFEINGETVFVWHQPDLNDGRIGLGADIGREGADAIVEFDNFEVLGP